MAIKDVMSLAPLEHRIHSRPLFLPMVEYGFLIHPVSPLHSLTIERHGPHPLHIQWPKEPLDRWFHTRVRLVCSRESQTWPVKICLYGNYLMNVCFIRNLVDVLQRNSLLPANAYFTMLTDQTKEMFFISIIIVFIISKYHSFVCTHTTDILIKIYKGGIVPKLWLSKFYNVFWKCRYSTFKFSNLYFGWLKVFALN